MQEGGRSKEKRQQNQVHNDAIWRQTINYELSTAKNWQQHWGFMREACQEYKQQQQKLCEATGTSLRLPQLPPSAIKPAGALTSSDRRDPRRSSLSDTTKHRPPYASGLPSKLPPGLTETPDSIVGDWLYTYNVPRVIRFRPPVEKYTCPATTSSEIGWSWAGTTEAIKRHDPTRTQHEDPAAIGARDGQSGPERVKVGQKGSFHTLERFGKHARGRRDVLKWWGGARESLP
ncbi:hypothetical protein BJ742DRAFT_763689 [Cladochytrium replicatum]|nr:hypothetical protein BJ742DRAFT_763689 [Cladochytrium replicatum]